MALGYLITLKRRNAAPYVTDAQGLRRACHSMHRVFATMPQAEVAGFAQLDNHLHVVVRTPSESVATELSRRLQIASVRTHGGDPHREADVSPRRTYNHWLNTMHYVYFNFEKHALPLFPFIEGTPILDVLGMRRLHRPIVMNLKRCALRFSERDILLRLGLTSLDPADVQVRHLREAALSAGCCESFASRSPVTHATLRATIKIAQEHGLTGTETARRLGVSRRRIHRAKDAMVDGELVRMIRRQLALREALTRRAARDKTAAETGEALTEVRAY